MPWNHILLHLFRYDWCGNNLFCSSNSALNCDFFLITHICTRKYMLQNYIWLQTLMEISYCQDVKILSVNVYMQHKMSFISLQDIKQSIVMRNFRFWMKTSDKDFFVQNILVKVHDKAALCMKIDLEYHAKYSELIVQVVFYRKSFVTSRRLVIRQTASDVIVSIMDATRYIWNPIRSSGRQTSARTSSWELLTWRSHNVFTFSSFFLEFLESKTDADSQLT